MKRILVTGGCGFVGSNIAKRLISLGHDVFIVDNLKFGNEKNLPEGCSGFYRQGFETLTKNFLSGFDTLIHCATSNIIYAMDNPIETFQNNATNTILLFSRFTGKIIYTSTASVYGQSDWLPTPEWAEIRISNAYDQSKYIAELFLIHRGNYTTLRLSNVYGDNQRADNPFCGVIGKLCYNIINDIPIQVNGDGFQTRDFTYIDDVVNAVVLSVDHDPLNMELNIASGRETSIYQLIECISHITDKKPVVNYVENRKIDGITRRKINVSLAEKKLGWKPCVFIKAGIGFTIDWIMNQKP